MEIYNFFCIVLISAAVNCAASNVAFYEAENYNGYLLDINVIESCTNLPRRYYSRLNSLTTDTCLILYCGENCTQTSFRLEAGSYNSLVKNLTHAVHQNVGNATKSFHKCHKNSVLPRITFYKDNDALAEYSNVSSCRTLQTDLDRTTRIDSHGSCVNLYFDAFGNPPSCRGSVVTIQGGNSILAQTLGNLTHAQNSTHPINSSYTSNSSHVANFSQRIRLVGVGPCAETLARYSHYYAIIQKVSVYSVPTTASAILSESAGIHKTFKNNGSSKNAVEYVASESVTQSIKTELITRYFRMENLTMDTGFDVEFDPEIPKVARGLIKSSLYSAYKKGENISIGESNITRKEINTSFPISQKLEIEPCSILKVTSSVDMTRNYTLVYKAYFKVRAVIEGFQLTAEELRKLLTDLEFIEVFDTHAIIAAGVGKMSMDFGVGASVSWDSEEIKNCVWAKPKETKNVTEVQRVLWVSQATAAFTQASAVVTLACFITSCIFCLKV